MIALLLSVLSSTLIFVVFKLYERFKINTLHAIVVNYMVASTCGFFMNETEFTIAEVSQFGWFYYALGLGVIFITVFNLMALTTQRSGLSVVSVATKMSVVIPVVFGLIYYNESLGFVKSLGILLALAAVYLAAIKTRDGLKIRKRNLIFPLLVFLGSGFIDTAIKFLEEKYIAENDVPLFSAIIFASAATVGVLILMGQAAIGKFKFEFRNILGGIALGIPNYFSIYFLVVALRSEIMDSSGIFTVNNVAIVLVSTLLGILFFKEKLLPKNKWGILLAVISIILIALGTA